MNIKIQRYKQASSSNDIARELASAPDSHGTVIVVDSQTNGRGRMGRHFISSSENGLYMSIILKPDGSCEKYNLLTPLASVAVLKAIERLADVRPRIKWVNDIYLNDKKICGILTESKISENGFEYIICGIGVNITAPSGGFDKEISSIAGAIFEGEAPNDFKMQLCKSITEQFFKYYDAIDNKEFMNIYREKSSIIGCEVDVYCGNEIVSGIATDIDQNGALCIKCKDGSARCFNSGEARVRARGVAL